MKKIIAVLLTLCSAAILLTGCNINIGGIEILKSDKSEETQESADNDDKKGLIENLIGVQSDNKDDEADEADKKTASENKREFTWDSGWASLSMEFPISWIDKYEYDTGSYGNTRWIGFYESADKDNYGGWLCSVGLCRDNDPEDYKGEPHYDYIGEVTDSYGAKYGLIVSYPTDIQFEEKNRAIYVPMYDSLDQFVSSIDACDGAVLEKGVGGVTEYIIPYSDFTWLSEYDLKDLSKEELRIARNEIYARHGRKFKDAELQKHFDECSWYTGTIEPDKFDESVLNQCEKDNVKLITEYESKK